RVTQNMPARNIRAGDVITRIGTNDIKYVRDFKRALASWKSGTNQITVERAGKEVLIDIDRPPPRGKTLALLGILYGPRLHTVRIAPSEALVIAPRFISRISLNLSLGTTAARAGKPTGLRILILILLQGGFFVLFANFLPLA